MQANLFKTQLTGGASFNTEDPDYCFEACRDRLLVAITRAEQEGFLETHGALIEALRALVEEKQRVYQ